MTSPQDGAEDLAETLELLAKVSTNTIAGLLIKFAGLRSRARR